MPNKFIKKLLLTLFKSLGDPQGPLYPLLMAYALPDPCRPNNVTN